MVVNHLQNGMNHLQNVRWSSKLSRGKSFDFLTQHDMGCQLNLSNWAGENSVSSNRFRLTENRFASVSLVAFLLYMSISEKDIPHFVELISDPGTGLKPHSQIWSWTREP